MANETRIFRIPPNMPVQAVASHVDHYLRANQGLQVQGASNGEECVLQCRQEKDGWKTVSGRFGSENTVVPYENTDISALLSEAVQNIHGNITEYDIDNEFAEDDNSIPADPNVRNFSYTILDDKIYYRENSVMTPVSVSVTAENRIKGMIAIRDETRNLIELQSEDYPDIEIKQSQ